MTVETRQYRVVCRDIRGEIQRVWGDYNEAHAHQLAADLRKENWRMTYAVEPAPRRDQAA